MTAQSVTEIVGTFERIRSDRDGAPSKCDCDYWLEQVELSADGSFLYLTQRGRLDPEQSFEKGTWVFERDSIVVLRSSHEKGKMIRLFEEKGDANKWEPSAAVHTFKFHHLRLYRMGDDDPFRRTNR